MKTIDSNHLALATLLVWVAFEVVVQARDVLHGKGGTELDRGTRRLIGLVTAASIVLAGVIPGAVRHDSALWLPGADTDAPLALGTAIMWAGLVVRLWSIATLGAAFRTTVEVDADQVLVERGPYRWLRHPSYSGVLLVTTGYGVTTGAWPALAVAAIGPAAALARRIQIEERALTDAMGDAYRDYRRRTTRLRPGIW